MMKKALLVVSFGTSVPEARESITMVEQALCATAPQWDFFRAFTSPTIRKILGKRGEQVLSLEEALGHLAENQYKTVIIQPTHLLYGIEYDKIKETADSWRKRFASLTLGAPLLSCTEDVCRIAQSLSERYPQQDGQSVVFMGHGTEHFSNAVYPALQTAFAMVGRADMLVGTVEGWPEITEIRQQLQRLYCKKVHLVPLMLVAGDHAKNDMAGDGDGSWKNQLKQDGVEVHCTMSGLGVLPEVQEMYCEHLHKLI